MALNYRNTTLPDRWPGNRTDTPIRAPFKAKWTDTLGLLEREVRAIRARDVVFRIDVGERDIRLDGGVRADSRPSSPAVIVEMYRPKEDGSKDLLSFPCDRYKFWEDNVRAIALTMEKLRAIDRYSVRPGSQYEGFKALPNAGQSTVTMDLARAARIIAEYSDHTAEGMITDLTMARVAVRTAASRTHPDSANGNTAAFQLVQTARKVLADHHGVTL